MIAYLQRIGKSLMFPVAVLPAAAILMGIGYWIDPTGWGANNILAAFLIKSGASLIDNMGLLFAVGVAFGMSKDGNGAAAISGLVAWLIVTTLLSTSSVAQLQGIDISAVHPAFAKSQNQFTGILCGAISAALYNRFYKVELHSALAFFSGRRLVPIVTSVVMLAVSFILMYVWPVIYGGLVHFGVLMSQQGAIGAGLFGFFNRLLLPVGLHHALNSVFWFDVAGINDIGNFWSNTGVKGLTGMYQAGFFPIMMFGLVGAAAAFVVTSKPRNKANVYSIMLAAGFASFFTGITEPIEFAFMFLSPPLYFLHAVLTGLSLFIAATFHWMAGFGFSAGFVDFILSSRLPLANQPYMLIIQGIIFGVIYFFLFKTIIEKFNLKTLGREDEESTESEIKTSNYSELAQSIYQSLGDKNIQSIDFCATRLRLDVLDSAIIDEAKIKKITAGVLKPSKTTVQIIIGPKVQFIADALKDIVNKNS